MRKYSFRKVKECVQICTSGRQHSSDSSPCQPYSLAPNLMCRAKVRHPVVVKRQVPQKERDRLFWLVQKIVLKMMT